jgi:hypothetical protein
MTKETWGFKRGQVLEALALGRIDDLKRVIYYEAFDGIPTDNAQIRQVEDYQGDSKWDSNVWNVYDPDQSKWNNSGYMSGNDNFYKIVCEVCDED